MNKKSEISVTITILLLLLVVTFAGTFFYIWYTNYLKESETSLGVVPPEQIGTILDIVNDQNTFYVTIRNNTAENIIVLKDGPVVGVYKGSGSYPCPLSDDLVIKPKQSGVAVISTTGIFELKPGTTYYISLELKKEGEDAIYTILQYYTPT